MSVGPGPRRAPPRGGPGEPPVTPDPGGTRPRCPHPRRPAARARRCRRPRRPVPVPVPTGPGRRRARARGRGGGGGGRARGGAGCRGRGARAAPARFSSIHRDRGGARRRRQDGCTAARAPAPAPVAAAAAGPGATGGPGQPARRALEQLQPAPAAGGLHRAGERQRLPGHLLPPLQRLGARAPAGAVRALHGERGGLPHLQHQPGLQALGVQPAPRAPQPHQVLGEVPALQRLLAGLRVPCGAGVLLHLHADAQPPPGLPEDEGVRLLRLHVALRGEAGAHPAAVHPAARGEDRGPGQLQPGDAQTGEEHQRHQPQAGTLALGRGRRALPHDAAGLLAPGAGGGPASVAPPSGDPPTCCPS